MAEGDRVEALFHEAADLPPEGQRALLDAACAGAPALRARVEALLADDARLRANEAATFLQSPLLRVAAAATLPAVPERTPPSIGRYRILRLLGEGGMGTVYEAEQDNPRRPVALKVIRTGLTSPSLRKRFTQEVQILGRLHHPGIAQIYEAGVAEDGQPFFAMEFIQGVALDEYERHQSLGAAARLELLARVCDAVHHAHEQGVIHRDLKPSNILVDEHLQPRVLDFGVARVSAGDLGTSTDRTRTGQLVGTLSYMSPEQVAGDPAAVDRRSDVYALGVVLYESLAGRLPYALDGLSLPEAVRVIREQEPARLSALDSRFRGDVETIVAKALEKDPARRYPSAADLAADIRRLLQNEPIRARPPSALYQLRKFARRHKAVVGGAAAVLAALVLGLIGTSLFALRASQERAEAETNARQANAEKQIALDQTYRARIAAAAAALQNHDVAATSRHLNDAPQDRRDWEWWHLHSRLDDSISVSTIPDGATCLLTRSSAGLGSSEKKGTVPLKKGDRPLFLRRAILAGQTLRLLDDQGRTERTVAFPPRHSAPWALIETQDGWLLLDDPDATTVRLLDQTGAVRLRVQVPTGAVLHRLTASPNLKWIAVYWTTVTAGHCVSVYDASSGKEQVRLSGVHREIVWTLAFSPDGTRLATASDDGTARLWDVATGRPIGEPLCHPDRLKVLSAAFSPDGARLVTASADGTVCQWSTRNGEAIEPPYERHTGEVWTAVYSPDGQWIASGGTDRTVRLWRARGRRDVLVLHGHVGKVIGLAFSADGRRLGSVSGDGSTRIWDTDPRLPVLRGHTNFVYPVACSADGQWIASGGWDGKVRLWDARTGEECAALPHPGFVRTLAFGPDSSWLVSAGEGDPRLYLWNVATGRRRTQMDGPGEIILVVAVRPDGTQIAALDSAGKLSVREVATGREVAVIPLGGRNQTKGLAFSPDGRWLAATTPDFNVCLWDAQTYQLSARLSGHTREVFAVAFSPDSRRLASAGEDRIVRVWDVATATCQTELRGHTDSVFAVAFHPGGTRLATAGNDRAVWLWDLSKGEEVARLPGHANYIWSLAFSPDGKTLVSGSGDKTVRLWDTEPLAARHAARREVEELRPEAERLVTRLLEEKREPLGVWQTLEENATLTKPLRRAAFQALLRWGQTRR